MNPNIFPCCPSARLKQHGIFFFKRTSSNIKEGKYNNKKYKKHKLSHDILYRFVIFHIQYFTVTVHCSSLVELELKGKMPPGKTLYIDFWQSYFRLTPSLWRIFFSMVVIVSIQAVMSGSSLIAWERMKCLLCNRTKLPKSWRVWHIDRGNNEYLFIATFLKRSSALSIWGWTNEVSLSLTAHLFWVYLFYNFMNS